MKPKTAPRWETRAIVSEMFPRHVRDRISDALDDTRVVFVRGARQVGKSTLAREIGDAEQPPRQTLTLDDKTTRDNALVDPTGFVAGLAGPVLIDEVQRAPELLLAIKQAVDRDETPGRFLLTGSADILTAPKISDALTGRVEIVSLWPLAQSEIERSSGNLVDALFAAQPPTITGATIGRDAFIERAVRGGYPAARLRTQLRRDRWFESYLQTTIERDLREIADIDKISEIPGLLRLLAAQAAGLYRADTVAKKLKLDTKTVQRYTDILQTVFLVSRIPGWRPGIGSREVQTAKLFLTDSGLLAHLLGANARRAADDSQVTGKLYENFVAMEVARLLDWAETPARQYHYRDRDDEVDIVLESRSGGIVCIECKTAATVKVKDSRPIAKLRDERGSQFLAGIVLYTGEQTVPLGDRLWAVPVSALWSSF